LRPGIVKNGGFESDPPLAGWDITENPGASVTVAALPFRKSTGWKRLPEGKKAVCLPRGAVLSQELNELQPGRMYSAECYSMTTSKATELERHPIRLALSGVDIVRRETRVSHDKRPEVEGGGTLVVCWNRHHIVFRPRSNNALLSITHDTTGPASAGGRMFVDFVQVQPFFAGTTYFAPDVRTPATAP